jgi:hypothetical protein
MKWLSSFAILAACAVSTVPAVADDLQGLAAIDWSIDHRLVAPGMIQDDEDADADLTRAPASEVEASPEWELYVQPYVWIPARIDGESTVAGATAELDLKFGDIIDNVDKIFAISGRVEAWNGRWGLFFDGMYTSIEAEFTVRPFPPGAPALPGINVDIAQSFLDLGVGWNAINQPIEREDGEDWRLRVDVLGGMRIQYLKQEITPPPGLVLGRSEDWAEILIGARVTLRLNEKLMVGMRTDVSGFGIGSGSGHTWNLIAGVDIHLKPTFDLLLGYRVLDLDYTNGSGIATFGLDVLMHGPYIGATFRF